ncbi:MAG: fumarylacetoacetate hydrolase [Verrucomicrobia bacterium]|nr:fumarylacetoacetate hydrolase [Verrucomicrobiota bacterium]
MKICRFRDPLGRVRAGVLTGEQTVVDLTPAGVQSLREILDAPDPSARAAECAERSHVRYLVPQVECLAPVENQEVWAAGVTYLRSKKARMEESNFSATAYDRVYEAPRPELFFKSMPEKVAGPGGRVGIRQDARWNVPEPELALVHNARGQLVGFTIGNDMSSRDIEGENLLYLPQGKIYKNSCALGPVITLGATEAEARTWTISLVIERGNATVFAGETAVSQIKRSFEELTGYLHRSQEFPHGAILLTGTGIVPADDFTLQAGDVVAIRISGIGELRNTVAVV